MKATMGRRFFFKGIALFPPLDKKQSPIEKRHSHRMPKLEFYGNVLCIGLGLRLSIQAIATISLRYSADEPLVSLPSGIGVADLEDSRGGAGAYA